jgi:hypothetical protein
MTTPTRTNPSAIPAPNRINLRTGASRMLGGGEGGGSPVVTESRASSVTAESLLSRSAPVGRDGLTARSASTRHRE